MQEFDHILSVDEDDVLYELCLEGSAMLGDELAEIQGQLVNDWHSSFQNIEYILSVFQQAFVALYSPNTLDDVSGVINIQLEFFSHQISSDIPESSSYITKDLQVPQIALKARLHACIHIFD